METALKWPAGAGGGVKAPWRWAPVTLLVVLMFEGLGGLAGGPLLVAAPDGRYMKIPVEELNGFFPDFLIPGLLLTALGALNVAAFVVVLRRLPSAWLWAGLAIGGFAVWFAVELATVGAKNWAQAVWGIPVLIGALAAWPLMRRVTAGEPMHSH